MGQEPGFEVNEGGRVSYNPELCLHTNRLVESAQVAHGRATTIVKQKDSPPYYPLGWSNARYMQNMGTTVPLRVDMRLANMHLWEIFANAMSCTN